MSANINVKRGRRPSDEPNLFARLARCSKCGGALRFFRESANVSQRYLKCYHAVSKACSAGFVNYDAFEKEVIGWLLLDQDDSLIKLTERKPDTKPAAATRIQELRARQEKLVELAGSDLSSIPAIRAGLMTTELEIRELTKAELDSPPEETLFAERAWELVERHENAKLSGDKEALYEVRGEIKVAFQRSISKITVYPERRIGDLHYCKFDVTLRSRDGELHRKYTRPALTRIKGVYNGANSSTEKR
ncbi:MAG: hypothetical protein EON54_21040 [Alcaligenaceae bacterium]|nr:MAG: hypothetical protein EON54_21040 [Alcaligenaceae bacterium]